MTLFDALNKLGNLIEVSYRIESTMPDVLIIFAYDERSGNPVCWCIAEAINWHDVWDWRTDTQFAADEQASKEGNGGGDTYSYYCGLAYVNSDHTPYAAIWPMGVVQLERHDYAALIAAARGEA